MVRCEILSSKSKYSWSGIIPIRHEFEKLEGSCPAFHLGLLSLELVSVTGTGNGQQLTEIGKGASHAR